MQQVYIVLYITTKGMNFYEHSLRFNVRFPCQDQEVDVSKRIPIILTGLWIHIQLEDLKGPGIGLLLNRNEYSVHKDTYYNPDGYQQWYIKFF